MIRNESMDKLKILYMGTPDFALSMLKALVEEGYDVAAVVTQTDKPKGRGYEMTPPPVKVYAIEKNIPVYQPSTLKNDEFFALLSDIDPNLIVVAAYGKMLPQNVLDYPKYGCINVHGSLLPKYRGASPIQSSIINGEKVTGITTQMMDIGCDTGDILEMSETEILPEDNYESLHDKLALLGEKTLIQTLKKLEAGTLVRTKQNSSLATHTSKITKADCALHFDRPASELFNQIRGLSPIPLAYTMLNGKALKITSAVLTDKEAKQLPGTVVSTDNGTIEIVCGDGKILAVTGVLPEGKSRMAAADFINGRKVVSGDVLL